MKTTIAKIVALSAIAVSLSGCVGSNAVTGMLMKFNVEAVDNRYARGGLNMLLAPVYGITVAADYVIFNSLEFWTGKNPLNGKPHIFDTKTDTMIDINDDLDDSLKEAPIDPISQYRTIERGYMTSLDENTIQMDITYNNGERATLVGVKEGENISYFIDGKLVVETNLQELEEYLATQV